ncbi:hypothetical protein BYT27DRAFT_7111057, partial [Phlegmacium glaucopus]
RVCNIYLRCGHRIQLVSTLFLVECYESPRCKFSPYHSAMCTPPACIRTCTQL